MSFKRSFYNDNILIHKFIINRDLNNLYLIKYNKLYYNHKKYELLKRLNYYNKMKFYYDKKFYKYKEEIIFFDLKYNKILYNYNRVNDFDLNNCEDLIKDRLIHNDILTNDYRKYFNKDNVDDFVRIYFDIFLEIKNNYFGKKIE
jgi:hypothetical protein